jgi:hypothetical protein
MFQIFWMLLNLALVICFIVAAVKVTRLLRQKLGLFTAIMLVLGLLSFAASNGRSSTPDPVDQGRHNNVVVNGNEVSHEYVKLDLEKMGTAKFELMTWYKKYIKTGENVPDKAYCTMTGIIGYTEWEPQITWVMKTSDNHKFQYYVVGVLHWKLMGGITLYSQEKTFEGTVAVK